MSEENKNCKDCGHPTCENVGRDFANGYNTCFKTRTEAPKPDDSSGSAEFNCSAPDVIGNARKRGAIDFVNGAVVGNNPYQDSDARHWAWMEGWAGAGLAAH